tara:strand:+ start:2637 stop:2801 length:165 start_codon:yes stop_codon:yes gene_type:complete
MFTDKEKEMLKILVKKELESFEAKDDAILFEGVKFTSVEKKYDQFLKDLLEKLS